MSQAAFNRCVELEDQYNKNKHNKLPPSPSSKKLYISFISLLRTDLLSDSTSDMHVDFQTIDVQEGLKKYFDKIKEIGEDISDSYKILSEDIVGASSIIPYNEEQIITNTDSEFRASADYYYIPGFYFIEKNGITPKDFDPNKLSDDKDQYKENNFFKNDYVSEDMVIYVILIQQYFNIHIQLETYPIKEFFKIPKFPDMVSSVKNDPNPDFNNNNKNTEIDIYSFYIAAFNNFGKTNEYKIVLEVNDEYESKMSFMPCLFKTYPEIGDKNDCNLSRYL